MTENTTAQLLAEIEDESPERRAEIEAEIQRRGHSPAFLRVAKVFADHFRFADDELVADVLAAARADAAAAWPLRLSDEDKIAAVLALVELCNGDEFAAWMNSESTPEMPLAALREYELAVVLVKRLMEDGRVEADVPPGYWKWLRELLARAPAIVDVDVDVEPIL